MVQESWDAYGEEDCDGVVLDRILSRGDSQPACQKQGGLLLRWAQHDTLPPWQRDTLPPSPRDTLPPSLGSGIGNEAARLRWDQALHATRRGVVIQRRSSARCPRTPAAGTHNRRRQGGGIQRRKDVRHRD